MRPVIELKDVTRSFSSRTKPVVSDLTMKVKEGEVVGFLGPNGAGKTTTIKMLLGFLSPQKGAIKVLSHPPYTRSARQQIGFLPETSEYYWFLTPYQLLKFYGTCFDFRGKNLDRKIHSLLETVNMRDYTHEKIKNFSKGMKQRIGIAQALLNNPRLLILDEPASGLDPIGRKEIRELIEKCAEQNKTIFFSSHELGEVETVCNRLAILSEGELLFDGSLEDLKLKNKQVTKIIVKADFPALLKKIRETGLREKVKLYETPEKLIEMDLYYHKCFYDLIDILKAAHARVLYVGDKQGSVEEAFFQIIHEQRNV